MKALIDGDILVYKVGFKYAEEPEEFAIAKINDMLETCLFATGSDEFMVCLSDSTENGFRYKLCQDYKANRKGLEKPQHYSLLRQHLIDSWGATVAVQEEADDLLGINQTEDTIICSIDKDLKQIPGHHYNLDKAEFSFVSPEEGLVFFYKQLLMGDKSDNIGGVRGIGPVKADKILEGLTEELDLFTAVWNTYKEALAKDWNAPHEGWDRFKERQVSNIVLLTGQLLKIRTKEGEIWGFPNGWSSSLGITHESEFTRL